MTRLLLTGRARDVFDRLKALVAARKPKPQVIYVTTITATFIQVKS